MTDDERDREAAIEAAQAVAKLLRKATEHMLSDAQDTLEALAEELAAAIRGRWGRKRAA